MKFKCNKCNIPITRQLSKRWICRPCKREADRVYYHGIGKAIKKKWQQRYYQKNCKRLIKKMNITTLKRVKFLRIAALKHYGNKCACCGEKQYEFLAIDHIKGGGTKHRKSINGKNIYLWLFQQKYPKGFQVLCHNCNQAKGYYGRCPHKNQSNKVQDNG